MINRSLRHVLAVLMLCFVALFVQLNRIQYFQADELRQHPDNTRTIQRDFARERGPISTRDGQVVAVSTPVAGPLERQRNYPEGDLYAHTVGYLSFNLGAQGVERVYSDDLIGRSNAFQISNLSGMLSGQEPIGEVVLTMRHDLQTTAKAQLGERKGSVVALDPRTGEVLALWSYPSFDPNLLSGVDGTEVNANYQALVNEEGNPLRAKAYRDIFFPGSTFKVVTAAAALATNTATLSEPVFLAASSYTAPLTTRPLRNFGGSTCGGDLLEMLRVSCNTAFAQLGAELLGPDRLSSTAQDFGFNLVPPFDLPGVVASRFPTDYGEQLQGPTAEIPAGVYENTPLLAQTSIGQNDVSATPLQMALVAAGIANNGEVMAPHVVAEVKDRTGSVVSSIEPERWQRAVSPAVALDLRDAMVNIVEAGTAGSAGVQGIEVGAKTGTAQLGTDPPKSHAWMIAFAGPPGRTPEIAIAVLLEGTDGASEQTGGRVAGPIVRAMIEAYFQR